MLQTISEYSVNYLINKRKITMADSALFQYGFEIFYSSGFILLSIPLLSYLLFSLADGIIFLLFFVPIRFFCGGYHAATYLKCYLCTATLFLSCTFASYHILPDNLILITLLNLSSGCYILKNSPLIHPNHPLSAEKIKINGEKTQFMICLNVILSYLLFLARPHYGTLASITTTLVACLIYIPKKGGTQYVR